MPKKPPKKPGDDAPEPEEPEDPKKGSGKRIRNPPIDITNWRQQSQNRAHERNRITYIAVDLAGFMRARRVDKGMSQPDVAYNLELPDGTPHPIVWRVMERIDDPDASPRVTRDMAAKSVNRLEAYVQEPTLSLFLAWCKALGDDPSTVLQGLGWSQRSSATESAIMADDRFGPEDKRAILLLVEQLRRDR